MRLIDAGYIINRITEERRRWGDDYDVEQVLGDIEDAPTIDAIPVVRCRNCEHAEVYNYLDMWCNKFDRAMAYKWFCSFGERRTDA